MRILLMAFYYLCLLVSPSEASLFLSPVGHREAFLGNSGAGLSQSPGAVLFNPAGMAFFKEPPALSLSGSAVSYQEFSDPGNIQDYLRSSSSQGTAQVISTSELQRQTAVGGIAYAGQLGTSQAWGVGINIVYRRLDGLVHSQNIDPAGSIVHLQKNLEQQTTLVLNPGYLWVVSDDYSVGASVQWKALNVYSEGDQYVNQMLRNQVIAK